MTDVLTRPQDFQAILPSSVLPMQPQTQYDIFTFSEGFGISVGTFSPSPVAFLISKLRTTNVASEGRPSPAVFTKQWATTARIREFVDALNDARELSRAMVEENEAAALDPQTWAYAIRALVPFFLEAALPPPLMLPLQNGGIGAEWHAAGMNIELRFRNPYRVYAVVEDARNVIPSLHGSDPHLVRARVALRELAARAVG